MFRFQHPTYFALLIIIPILILLYIGFLKWRNSRIKQIGSLNLINQLIFNKIPGRVTTKFVLTTLAILFGIIGLANLQKGAEKESVTRKGTDVIFALDVSKSMLAKDISPNRLERAKILIQSVINQLAGDRVGLVVFAGHAYQQVPITSDYAATKMLLASVQPGMIPTQGTVLSEAIQLSDEAFNAKNKKAKTLILITDGEDHDEQAIAIAKEAAQNGLVIHTIGIGSKEGAPIFDPTTKQNKVDAEGKEVITKLNEDILKEIASTTNGSYQLLANNSQVATQLVKAINKQAKDNDLGAFNFTAYKNYFQYFLVITLILLIIDMLIPIAQRNPKLRTQQNSFLKSFRSKVKS